VTKLLKESFQTGEVPWDGRTFVRESWLLKSNPALREARCPTGKKGGVDNSCKWKKSVGSTKAIPSVNASDAVVENLLQFGQSPFSGILNQELLNAGATELGLKEFESLRDGHRYGGEQQAHADAKFAENVAADNDLGKTIRASIAIEEAAIEAWNGGVGQQHMDRLAAEQMRHVEWMYKNGMIDTDDYPNPKAYFDEREAWQYKFEPMRFYRKGEEKTVMPTSTRSEGGQSYSVTGAAQPKFSPDRSWSYDELKAKGYRVLGGFGQSFGYQGESEIAWIKAPGSLGESFRRGLREEKDGDGDGMVNDGKSSERPADPQEKKNKRIEAASEKTSTQGYDSKVVENLASKAKGKPLAAFLNANNAENFGPAWDKAGPRAIPIHGIAFSHEKVRTNKLFPSEYDSWDEDPSDPKHVAKLADAFKSGEKIKPVLVHLEADGATVLDGHHRVKAAMQAGIKDVPVIYTAESLAKIWKDANADVLKPETKAKSASKLAKEYADFRLRSALEKKESLTESLTEHAFTEAFCATGKGGKIDNSCSSKKGAKKSAGSEKTELQSRDQTEYKNAFDRLMEEYKTLESKRLHVKDQLKNAKSHESILELSKQLQQIQSDQDQMSYDAATEFNAFHSVDPDRYREARREKQQEIKDYEKQRNEILNQWASSVKMKPGSEVQSHHLDAGASWSSKEYKQEYADKYASGNTKEIAEKHRSLLEELKSKFPGVEDESRVLQAYYGEPKELSNDIVGMSEPRVPSKVPRGGADEALRSFMERSQIAVQVDPSVLGNIASSGVLSASEGGKKGVATKKKGEAKSNYIEKRSELENKLFGIDVKASSGRPVYGLIDNPARLSSNTAYAARNYGAAQIRLKPEVKSRSTYTIGDSLDDKRYGGIAGPVTDPLNHASVPPFGFFQREQDAKNNPSTTIAGKTAKDFKVIVRRDAGADERTATPGYIEAQIHGGIAPSDIAEVRVPKGMIADAALKKLRKANIPVRFL